MRSIFKKLIFTIFISTFMLGCLVSCSGNMEDGGTFSASPSLGRNSGTFSITGGQYDGKSGDYEKINDNKYHIVSGSEAYYVTRANKNAKWKVKPAK